jgi:DNA helicase-2/ATP-dependent DNA helicase PcrA
MVNKADEISWKRLLRLYPRIGVRTAEHIFEYIRTIDDPLQAFITKEIGQRFKAIPVENIEAWALLFNELTVLSEKDAIADMLSAILSRGYTEYLKFQYPNSELRLEDIGQLINFSSQYNSLETFLSELSLMSGVSGEEIVSAAREDERVILSTIHQAKGLEWRIVFIIWCAEGRFPNPKAVEDGNLERREDSSM